MAEFWARASLDFGAPDQWGSFGDPPYEPPRMPVFVGPFTIYESPNYDFYFFNEVYVLDPEEQQVPAVDPLFPISAFCVDTKIRATDRSNPNGIADEQFERLEKLLRLFQGGDVSVRRHDWVWEVHSNLQRPDWGSNTKKPSISALYQRPAYRFDDHSLERLTEFIGSYLNLVPGSDNSVNLALSRFNMSYERRESGDRLVDLVIALEALFGDRGDSVSYKVASRCACWLHPHGENRWHTYREIREAYDQRSRVVHGSMKREFDPKDLDNLESLIRAALVKYLKQQTFGGKIPIGHELDELIMTGRLWPDQ